MIPRGHKTGNRTIVVAVGSSFPVFARGTPGTEGDTVRAATCTALGIGNQTAAARALAMRAGGWATSAWQSVGQVSGNRQRYRGNLRGRCVDTYAVDDGRKCGWKMRILRLHQQRRCTIL